MRAMIQCIHENNHRNLTFPSKEKELQILCDSLGISNTAKTEIKIGTVHNDERMTTLLSGKTVNLDELNFLTKRLDSFDQNELTTFFAVAYAEKTEIMSELINLSFNTHCYSVVADFSDPHAVGRQMYLTEQGAVSTEEFQSFDGQGYFEKILAENSHPLITPYGVVYKNGNAIEQIYDGTNFPYYQYDDTPIILLLNTQDRFEYLYLPVEQSELNKALERLGVESLENTSWQVEQHNLPDNIADMVINNQIGLDSLNQFTTIFKTMGDREVSALSELVDFTKITTAEQLKTLSDCMYEFECFPGVHTPHQYGRHIICESGHFEYDENLEDYIDFQSYAQDKISRETGVFTDKGYLLYHGYNQEMQNILRQTLGLKTKEMQEPQELKLYMPLKAVTYYDENDYGDLCQVDFEMEVYPEELSCYEDEIREAIRDRRLDEEKRGMMDYYDGHDSVNAKVQQYLFDVELIKGKLMGIVTLTLNAPLNQAELDKIKETIEGQCSDGFGEGFEQREINCNGKEIYVSLWGTNDWSLKTAEEMGITEQKYEMQFGGM
ncbi:antirestriction protein ArdA [Hydrogenoanaerobacterium sp.]|uniref:antirestriction protein ArdA n=1 Tax=Hydrogenoanaerobacterium sp. TaxID=2953763 RepID=UPI0028971E7F|nr:antirestriction protein ArdA [Hydrogenoanaerobacterium sp.]